jgi:hypothetical protein
MTSKGWGTAWAGLMLIGLGIAFLVANAIGWDRIWPVFPMLGGLAFFGGYVASGFKEGGFVFVGTAALLVGLFLFGFSLGIWAWEQMAQLWPVFPLIGGVALVALFIADRQARDLGVLGVALAALIVGVVGLAATHGLVSGDIVNLWPLLVVLLGLAGLVSALWRMYRRT